MAKGEETKQRIIEQSAPVFNRLGYGNTAMSDLMDATGLGKGGIYRHFESKEELACEVFDYACRTSGEERFAGIKPDDSGLEKIEKFVVGFANFKSRLSGGCPIFNAAVEHDDGNPVLKKKARAAYEGFVSKIATFVDEAKASGQVKKSVSSEKVAAFIVCSIEGALIARRLMGDQDILLMQSQMIMNYVKSL